MTPERWKKIEDIFQDALDLSGAARHSFIAEQTGDDDELRSEVEKLIARFETDEDFLESPVWTDSQILHSTIKNEIAESLDEDIFPLVKAKSSVGERVGVYRLTEEIGRGGMGVVYQAERADGEFSQRAAVKLIKRGMDTDFIVSRFRHERQILANLNHPNIARLLDGGTSKDGSPYFVMEFIEGAPLLKYCEENNLDLGQKLELFLRICDAITYAHRKKIIHRDIKPSNILVTKEGEPKLLDFGIAKILDTDSIHESLIPTATAMRLMTPEYASPEQVRGEEITPASDQYSLGVLLYELLSGGRPYKFPSRAPHEIARVICEEEVQSLRSKVESPVDETLERILWKSLRKNPAERYDSIEDFAADIGRFLRNETVRAESFTSQANQIELSPENRISPHRKGLKQGIFLSILSLVLIPVCVVLVVSGLIEPFIVISTFLTLFFGGWVRVLYALFFESGKAKNESGEAETKIIARETISGNQTTAQQTGKIVRSKSKAFLKYALATIAVILCGFLFYNIVANLTIDFSNTPPNEKWKNSFASTMRLKRLTTSGKAQTAAISPNGVNTAFVNIEGNRQSLWIRPTNSENARQLIAAETVFYTDMKFSPDNQWIYYIVNRAPQRTLYRISANGGSSQKISENVYNLFAFSPNGSQIVYDNQNSDNRQHSLFIAEHDQASGTIKSARTLFVLDIPNYFPGGFSFSPDGEKILYPRSVIEGNKETLNLYIYDLTNNLNYRLGTNDFNRIYQTAWRANGEEIIISASENESAPHQLWTVDFPSGNVSRITNDFSDYIGVSLTADSSQIATTKIDLNSNIWTSELSESERNFAAKAKQITSGFDRRDGFNGVNWTAAGRILYVSGAVTERDISLINADGTNNQTIQTGAADPTYPSLTKDNRFLIFADKKDRELNIWRYDMSNGTLEKISDNYAVTPALAPDDKTVFYSTLLNTVNNKLTVHRKSLEGGNETALTDSLSVRPVVSPDGKFIACNYLGEETDKKWQIALLPQDGDVPRFIQPYTTDFFINPPERPLAFSPDGRFLYFLNTAKNVTNIFRVSIEKNSSPVQVTHFNSGEIFDFSIAPDGKRVVISRGSTASDVVMFFEIKKMKNE